MKPQAQCREPSISEIREEIHNVLASTRFRQSPRLTKLLRYICSNALLDDGDQITEYTIAMDVLGKTEDFKEGKDAIVRVEVHRLRKRLSEFYAEEGLAHRVRIVIPPGNYAPLFQICEPSENTEIESVTRPDSEPPPHAPAPVRPLPWNRLPSFAWMVGIGLMLVVAAYPAYQVFRNEEQPLDAFWSPVLSSSNSNQILLCIGTLAGGHTHPLAGGPDDKSPVTLKDFHSAESQMVHVADATTLARIAGLIQARGKRYRIVSQSEATYSDLRRSPVVLIGLLNNDWTKRLVGNLRFTVERQGGGRVLIRDHTNPSRNDWFIDYYAPFLDVTRDYALVLRATDPKTEQMTVMAAGMSIFGTLAAGEFLTNGSEIRKLDTTAPKGWRGKNLEIVLSTEVIRGNPGPPTVVATHFW